jgi:hypothetical protein
MSDIYRQCRFSSLTAYTRLAFEMEAVIGSKRFPDTFALIGRAAGIALNPMAGWCHSHIAVLGHIPSVPSSP